MRIAKTLLNIIATAKSIDTGTVMISLETVLGKLPIMVTRGLPTLNPYYKHCFALEGWSSNPPPRPDQFEKVET
ncbi:MULTISPECIES: hypothetical protein [unclassified Nodularia (in: cyanobacteria)]|uniref:hypothetical protein n=1 Tax=unclassified Nodularia (in: cyanobacteria) TaxID=2656917 RepID=UPI0018825A46|nr:MULTISPECIES: hypothetical protein [unclassified Nodularia (in: cyanobacteria)]MBE9201726.1 hypothetical protein [Nodularia sp. LEGE 06071]MCC2691245.1 hypothetical protein [Nodularia sp. LEGE 04288]